MAFDNLDRYKKFEYAITGDVDAPDHGYHYSDEISELLHKTYLRVQKRKPHLIPELHKLMEKYPRVPTFKNYLSMYYNLSGKTGKAYEVNHWIVKEHPDYLHGKINLAAEAISKGNYDEVPKILGEALDLKDLYPHRKVFHISEFQSFFSITCQYLIETNQLEAAESRMEVAEKVLSHDPKITEGLRMQILAKRVLNRQKEEAAWNEKHGEEIGRSYDKSIQTDEKPTFHHPEIWALYEHDIRIPQDLLRNILELPRETLLQDLETVLLDGVRRFEYFGDMLDEWDEWRDEELSFPLHALLLLTELRATEKLPAILDLLRQGEELLEFWFSDHIFETVWHFVYHLGNQQLHLLKEFMQEPDICSEGKTIVSQAVVQIAFHHPERHEEVVNWYKDILQYYLDHLDTPKLVDVDVMAPIICDLSNLRATDVLPLCKPFFDLDLVDLGYAGDYKDIEEETHKPPSEDDKHTIYPNIFEHIKDILSHWYGYLTPEEQARRDAHFKEKMAAVDLENIGKKPTTLPSPASDYAWQETVIKDGPKVGRNDPCPCGSGKKYKKCCMNK
ncbi:MAG: DUF1186 domain-containing protein [Saprospiraceae bacterium]|nr:DUF1186 domain-containing protein [Saprospiraceae bacterium]